MEKICVYTCVTGNYDMVKDPYLEEGIDYILFTNNKKVTSCKWKVIYIEDEKLDNIRLARKIKIMGHPYIHKNYDISVWMDASCYMNAGVKDFIYRTCQIEKHDMVSFKHSVRDCIYEEGEACLSFGRGNASEIRKQLEKYKKAKYPAHNGLIESPVLVRWHNRKNVKQLMKAWFSEIKKESSRDQLSFNYCLYHHPIDVLLLDENVFNCAYFTFLNHLHTTFEKGLVYFDEGKGFSEENSTLLLYQKEDGLMHATIEIPKDVENVRIDLEETMGFSIEQLSIIGINMEDIEWFNYISVNHALVFESTDPIMILHHSFKKGDKIEIQFLVRESTYEELLAVNRSLYFDTRIYHRKINNQEKIVTEMEKQNKALLEEKQKLENQIQNIQNRKIFKIAQFFHRKIVHFKK